MYSGGYYIYSGVYHMYSGVYYIYSGVYYTVYNYNPPLLAEDDNQPKPVCSRPPPHQTCLLLQTWVAPKWTEPNNVQLVIHK